MGDTDTDIPVDTTDMATDILANAAPTPSPPLMLKPKLKLNPKLMPKLTLRPGATVTDVDVTTARDLLMPMLSPLLMLTTVTTVADTAMDIADTADTTVDIADTTGDKRTDQSCTSNPLANKMQ